MVRPQLIALETVGEDGFLRATTKSLSKYSMHIGVFVIAVRWSLTSEDAGDVKARGREDSRWRHRTCPNNMRKKASTDCYMSEVLLHCKELGLGAVFSIGKLHSMPLHIF